MRVSLTTSSQQRGVENLNEADYVDEQLMSRVFERFQAPERPPADPDSLREFNRRFRQGSFEEARRKAGDDRRFDFAMNILRKINPTIQQIAGSWAGKTTGMGS